MCQKLGPQLCSPFYLGFFSYVISFNFWGTNGFSFGCGCCWGLQVSYLKISAKWIGETAGYIERLLMHYSPYSFGLFLAQIFCLVLSPVFFAGVNYVLFSRAARSRVRFNSRAFRWTSYGFITSDIITFLVQSAGGALFSSDNYNIVLAGGKILVAGLSLQLASIVSFCLWMGRFDYILFREHKNFGEEYEKEWYRIRIARWVSMTGILVN